MFSWLCPNKEIPVQAHTCRIIISCNKVLPGDLAFNINKDYSQENPFTQLEIYNMCKIYANYVIYNPLNYFDVCFNYQSTTTRILRHVSLDKDKLISLMTRINSISLEKETETKIEFDKERMNKIIVYLNNNNNNNTADKV